jgi:hypothetical protein
MIERNACHSNLFIALGEEIIGLPVAFRFDVQFKPFATGLNDRLAHSSPILFAASEKRRTTQC